MSNMKTSFWLRITVAFSAILPSSVAFAGGAEGGGTWIESGFKTKILSTLEQLQEFTEPAKAQLKFDPDEVAATLEAQGRLYVLCAKPEIAAQIHAKGKLAYVFKEAPNTVSLDCTHTSEAEWKRVLDSQEPKDIEFALHEGLRVMGRTDENDYSVSGSYRKALRVEKKLTQKMVNSFLSATDRSLCRLDIVRAQGDNTLTANLIVNHMIRLTISGIRSEYQTNSGTIEIFGRSSSFVPRFLQGQLMYGREALEKVLQIAKQTDECWAGLVLEDAARVHKAVSSLQSPDKGARPAVADMEGIKSAASPLVETMTSMVSSPAAVASAATLR